MKYELEDAGPFAMIHIIGNIDTSEDTRTLDNEISRLLRQGRHRLVFNLAQTTFLDSGGISLFIHCLCDVQEHGGAVYIIAEENQVRRVLEMAGINRLITTYHSEAEFRAAHKLEKR